MSKLEEAFEFIDKHENADFEGKKDYKLVELAQQKLGLSFPQSYKSFLTRYGCGDIDGKEFFGIINDKFVPLPPDAVGLTIKARNQYKLPKQFILIYSDDDNYYAIDTSVQNEQYENPVVRIEFGNIENNKNIIFDSFGDFLYHILIDD